MDLQAGQKTSTEMSKLPFLISIPHGGTVIPEELKSRINLSPQELLADGDPYTGDIYDLGKEVVSQVQFDVARALVDVNRASDDLPPDNPDGVIKTVSIFNNPVYLAGYEPNANDITKLLSSYYATYHSTIESKLTNPDIIFAFDCHSMEEIGPPVANDAGKKRPLFCLGNNHGKACSEEVALLFAQCLVEAFSVPGDSITINNPFSGGYITKHYGMKPLPWLQIEMNRSLYLDEHVRDIDLSNSTIKRCSHLNYCFHQALRMFSETIS